MTCSMWARSSMVSNNGLMWIWQYQLSSLLSRQSA